ncbi:M48 family metallopeptidase [Corallococcus sicarius]|uniref:Peptidase M48 n=1 Tax=Corallococcus sicarius TaxID=2316726 RepID=A0A3A8NCX8_9BACT|nr:M48 family metallopeptidase [Corallococcus sicarius]RKH39045.1 peptidase M48 [Corallococcus sicarius]
MMSGSSFQGGLFSDEVPGKRAGATMRLGVNGIDAETQDGQSFSLPYAQCRLEMGGASGRMVFCHSPHRTLTLFCEDPAFLPALGEAGRGQLAEQVSQLTQEVRRARKQSMLRGVLGLLVVVLIGYGVYRGFAGVTANSIEALPIAIDEKVGKLAMESMDLEGPKVTDPVLVQAVDEIMSRLKPHAGTAGMNFEVTIVDAPLVNAYCLPGGQIVLFTGLLKAAKSPEQVAGVLGHEMAHATLRHGLKRIANSLGVIAAVNLLLGDTSGLVAVAVELAQHGLLTRHDREQETASDVEAVRMMAAAGLAPTALADFFVIMEKDGGDVPGAIAWLSSHPQLVERQKEIRQRSEKLGAIEQRPFKLDWEQVSRHAKEPGKAKDAKP